MLTRLRGRRDCEGETFGTAPDGVATLGLDVIATSAVEGQ